MLALAGPVSIVLLREDHAGVLSAVVRLLQPQAGGRLALVLLLIVSLVLSPIVFLSNLSLGPQIVPRILDSLPHLAGLVRHGQGPRRPTPLPAIRQVNLLQQMKTKQKKLLQTTAAIVQNNGTLRDTTFLQYYGTLFSFIK